MSDNPTPDAAPEAAPEAAPAEAAPDPSVQPEAVAEGSGELDIASLPPQAQEYIRELREEAKGGRKAHEPFKAAFSHFNEAEQEYLLNMVDTLGTNQDVGAQAMLELSQRMLGIEQQAEAAAEDSDLQEEAAAEGLSEDQYRELVRQEMQREQDIARVEAETEAVGFDPASDEAEMLWDLAIALKEPDLSVVAPILRQKLGLPEPDAPAEEPAQIEEAAPAREYPITATAPVGTAGTNAEPQGEIPALGSDALRERVLRRINASGEPG